MSGKLETEPLRRGPFISILLPAGSVGASQVVVGSYVGDAHVVGGVVNFGAGAEGDYSEEPLAATPQFSSCCSRDDQSEAATHLPCSSLKLQAQRQLQIAFALSGGATALREHLAEGCGVRRIQADIGGAAATAVGTPVRVVPDVVGFGAELETKAFIDGDGLE